VPKKDKSEGENEMPDGEGKRQDGSVEQMMRMMIRLVMA